jgi:hypothetical protein
VVVLALAAGLTRLLRSRSRAEAAPRAAAEAEGPDPLSPR